MLLLHATHVVDWRAWSFEPSVIGIALIVLGLYIYAAQAQPGGPGTMRVVYFGLGAGIMFLALVSPLHAAADRLLSFHMLQHVALTTIGPPLILLGLPRDSLSALLLRDRRITRVARLLTNPVFTATLFIVNMWLWHVPPLYEASLNHLGVHILMHVSFMATALLFWWPVIQPVREVSAIGEGGRLLYLFASCFPMGLLALLMLSSGDVLYSYYQATTPLWGIAPLTDQQMAGVIMGALGEAGAFIGISLLFFRYLDHEGDSEPAPARPRPADVA